MLVYNVMVDPVMLYNCRSWTVTTALLHKLDACHRRHLRSILGMCWPKGIISNEDLYMSYVVAQDRCRKYGGCVDPCSAMCCACPKIPTHNCPCSLRLLSQINTGAELVAHHQPILMCCAHISKKRASSLDLTRFAIQAKGLDGTWTRKPLAYRESNNVHLRVTRPPEICVNLVFKHIHAASSYTICRQFVPLIYCPL